MKKTDINITEMYKTGEVEKICDVSRKFLLVYEDAKIITPAYINKGTGYRYYSADNITQIFLVKSLRSLGLSLSEIREYLHDPSKINYYIQRFENMRDQLNFNIRVLKNRMGHNSDDQQDYIEHTTMPRMVFFGIRKFFNTSAGAIGHVRDTYYEALKTGYINNDSRLPIIGCLCYKTNVKEHDDMVLIAMKDDYNGPNRIVLEESPVIMCSYRGTYENLGVQIEKLKKYAKENHLNVTGTPFLNFLDGPVSLGNRSDLYLTQIILPISRE